MIECELEGCKNNSERMAASIPEQLGLIWKANIQSFEEFEQAKLARIFSLTKLSEVHIDVALIYAKKLDSRLPTRPHLTNQGYNNYFIGCLLLASKFLDDITFKNNSWSYVSGIPLLEINNIEQNLLRTLGFRLFVAKEEIATQRKIESQDIFIGRKERLIREIMVEKMISLDF